MGTDDTIATLRRNALEFDCGEMVLTQVAAGNPIVHRGKGFVRQNEDGVLTFKIYATTTDNLDAITHLQSILNAKSGRLYAPSDFFELSALSSDGTRWRAERILPRCNWPPGSDAIVTGDLQSLYVTASLADSAHVVEVHFFDHVDLPHSLFSEPEVDGGTNLSRDLSK